MGEPGHLGGELGVLPRRWADGVDLSETVPEQVGLTRAFAEPVAQLGQLAGDRGVLLDVSWRMHPDVCDFVSRTMYDGKLSAEEHCVNQRIDAEGLTGTGLRMLAVEHSGNRTNAQSQDEPQEAVSIIFRHYNLRKKMIPSPPMVTQPSATGQ